MGLSNYVRMFADSYAGNTWLFTLKFTFWNTIIENVAAILLAVALDSGIKGQKLLRTVFFVPCLISAVVVGFVWLKIYGNVLPALFKSLGIDANPMLFGKESTVLGGFLIANNWQWIGYWMLIYLAALQSIPGDLYEAGQGGWRICPPAVPAHHAAHAGPGHDHLHRGHHNGLLKVYDLLVSSTKRRPRPARPPPSSTTPIPPPSTAGSTATDLR